MTEKKADQVQEEEKPDMVQEAINLGAEVVDTNVGDFGKVKGIKEALGDGKIDFHPELPKIKFPELLERPVVLKQVRIIDDWDGQFGASTFALILVEYPDGHLATTIAGGKAVIRQIRKLQQKKMLPVKVVLTKVQSGNGEYYLFE